MLILCDLYPDCMLVISISTHCSFASFPQQPKTRQVLHQPLRGQLPTTHSEVLLIGWLQRSIWLLLPPVRWNDLSYESSWYVYGSWSHKVNFLSVPLCSFFVFFLNGHALYARTDNILYSTWVLSMWQSRKFKVSRWRIWYQWQRRMSLWDTIMASDAWVYAPDPSWSHALYRRVSHNVVTMETNAIGWPPWLITFWYSEFEEIMSIPNACTCKVIVQKSTGIKM